MKKIITVDDLDRLADPESEILADETVLLQVGDVRVELDLTAEHAKELRELVAPWLAAGAPLVEAPRKPPAAAKEPAKPRHGRAPTEYNAGMRRFAEARGINYKGPSGKPYYNVQLKADYEQFLRSGGTI